MATRPLSQLVAGQSLFSEGDLGSDVFQLVRGTLCFYQMTANGHRMVCGFVLANEVFSLSHKGVYLYSADASSDCMYRRLRRTEIATLSIADDTLRTKLSMLQNEGWDMHAGLLRRLHSKADEKVAHFLLEIAHRSAAVLTATTRIRLHMTRADIGSHLGLTVETVVRSIKHLVHEGVLICFSPQEFAVRNISELNRRAGLGRN